MSEENQKSMYDSLETMGRKGLKDSGEISWSDVAARPQKVRTDNFQWAKHQAGDGQPYHKQFW